MAKKQTRRSISLSAAMFEQAKGAAELAEVSLSQYAEAALRERMMCSALGGAVGKSAEKPIAELPVGNMVTIMLDANDAQAFREWCAARTPDGRVGNEHPGRLIVDDPVVEYDEPVAR